MPAIRPPAKVLVTGANGYIAGWIVATLLQRGFSVVGTVRSDDRGHHVRRCLQKLLGEKADRFEYQVVQDVCQEGVYDRAVEGVDAVAHTSPHTMVMEFDDPAVLLDPALKGTTTLIDSILKHGQGVKRITLLSSDMAIRAFMPPQPVRLDENDWNEEEVQQVRDAQARGDMSDVSPSMVYAMCKLMSERIIRQYHESHKHEIGWDVVTFCPSMAFGPFAIDVPSPDMTSSMSVFWYILCTSNPIDGVPSVEYFLRARHYVDVRDVAEAIVRALEIEEAGGERFLILSDALNWEEWIDAAHDLVPPVLELRKQRVGDPKGTSAHVYLDNSRSKRILGMKYKGSDEILRDTMEHFRHCGWLKAIA